MKNKIEVVSIFKKRIGNEHKLYVEYKNKEYILSELNYEEAKKEAKQLLQKINKNIVID